MCKHQPNIVQLHEWFEDEDYCYMVFEKMHGGPLLNRIQQKVCFTEQEASLVTRDIASALKFLHGKGIAHRDVKPENILCTDPHRVSPVKLCDLDLASKPATPSKKSKRGLQAVHSEPNLASPVGSAEFMAPEVVDAFVGDALKYDKRCDMWSLGVIIYIMLCGYPPFYGECERENCGWDQGKPCTDCQENLFHRIQRGEFDFPDEEWASISPEAKDLIVHLLVRNVRLRYTADDVLRHPWVKLGAPHPTVLQTPANLCRNDSTREIHQMNEHFNVMNRITSACMQLGSTGSGSTGSESSSDAGSPQNPGSPVSLELEEVKTPMPPPVESVEEEKLKLNGMFKQNGTLVDMRDPVDQWAEVRELENLELGPATPSPPIYMDQQFSFVQPQVFSAPMDQQVQQQLIHHNGMVYSAQPPPAMCSYPVVMMNHPHPAHMAHPHQLYMGPPMGHPAYGNSSSQGMPAQQIFYPPSSTAFYYVYPPPADMVNA
jgi:serine/threonine protein kinase